MFVKFGQNVVAGKGHIVTVMSKKIYRKPKSMNTLRSQFLLIFAELKGLPCRKLEEIIFY